MKLFFSFLCCSNLLGIATSSNLYAMHEKPISKTQDLGNAYIEGAKLAAFVKEQELLFTPTTHSTSTKKQAEEFIPRFIRYLRDITDSSKDHGHVVKEFYKEEYKPGEALLFLPKKDTPISDLCNPNILGWFPIDAREAIENEKNKKAKILLKFYKDSLIKDGKEVCWENLPIKIKELYSTQAFIKSHAVLIPALRNWSSVLNLIYNVKTLFLKEAREKLGGLN